jgi:ATP diphosphatase
VPPSGTPLSPEQLRQIDDPVARLQAIMVALRDPQTGCPWDVAQDFATIAPYTIEEAYEVADAIAEADWPELCAELGDLLLQVVFHARIAQERGLFTLDDVATSICDKMIARHPHVFASADSPESAAAQTLAWEVTKAAERQRKGVGILEGIARALPALTRAEKLQNRAARVGFDWPGPEQVLDKIAEEAREVVEARATLTQSEVNEEIGDLLFVMANLARHLNVDPEAALRAANDKFSRRFASIEAALAAQGRSPSDADLAEMEALWTRAKEAERTASNAT